MILPPATIGIVGGGQLGQMIAQEAVSLGYDVIVLDPTPGCPAAKVAKQIVAEYDSAEAVAELFASCDVVTYEFENVDAQILDLTESGSKLPQGVRALRICQNRALEKLFLTEIGVPVAPYRLVDLEEQLDAALADLGYPSVLKTTTGGYDGKGQVVLHGVEDRSEAAALASRYPCVLEEWVPFEKEISVIVAGNGSGQYYTFPPSENEHRNNILYRSTVPANISDLVADEAKRISIKIARELDLHGVMGIEMFVLPGGQVLVNEMAPRPHNSGHYTIEACDYSQFQAHVRGVCGLPLGEPVLLSPAVMTNILGEDLDEALAQLRVTPGNFYHLYGKEHAAAGRKMGHVTTLRGATQHTGV